MLLYYVIIRLLQWVTVMMSTIDAGETSSEEKEVNTEELVNLEGEKIGAHHEGKSGVTGANDELSH